MRRKAIISVIFMIFIFLLFGCSNYNRSPFKPTAVYPKNGDSNIPFDLTLSWKGGDPDGDPVTYLVYFGKENLNPLAETTLTTLTVHLDSYGTYKWKIVAKDPYGDTSESDTWTFSTKDPPKPSASEVTIVGESEIDIIDVSDPMNPSLTKTIPISGVKSVYFGKEYAYAAGCSWISKLSKDDFHEIWREEIPGCTNDIAVGDYIYVSMGEDGVEYLDPSSPSTNGVIKIYSEGMDDTFDSVYVASGGGGIYGLYGSFGMRVATTNVWVSDVKWSGNILYFMSRVGIGRMGKSGFIKINNLKSFDASEYMVYALSEYDDVLHILDFSEAATEVATITLDGAEDVKAVGDYIYAVGDKFYSVDVSNPKRPIITGVSESIKGSKFAQN